MDKPTVLVDCDGVLSDFVGHYCATASRLFERKFHPAEVNQWDTHTALGLSHEQKRAVEAEIGRPGWVASMPIYGESLEFIGSLRSFADVVCVTSPWPKHSTWVAEREAWLEAHLGFTHDEIVHTCAKHHVRGDFIVDDKPSHLLAWQNAHPDGRALLRDRPYNQDVGVGTRVRSLSEVTRFVRVWMLDR